MNRFEAGTAFGIDQKFVINNMVLTAQGEKLKPKRKPRNKVATHEPGPGYLGATKPKGGRVKPIQAVAPAAAGGDGIWHDLNLVRAMGYDPESLFGAARSELAARDEEV